MRLCIISSRPKLVLEALNTVGSRTILGDLAWILTIRMRCRYKKWTHRHTLVEATPVQVLMVLIRHSLLRLPQTFSLLPGHRSRMFKTSYMACNSNSNSILLQAWPRRVTLSRTPLKLSNNTSMLHHISKVMVRIQDMIHMELGLACSEV